MAEKAREERAIKLRLPGRVLARQSCRFRVRAVQTGTAPTSLMQRQRMLVAQLLNLLIVLNSHMVLDTVSSPRKRLQMTTKRPMLM